MANTNSTTLEKTITKEEFNHAKLSFKETLSYGLTGFGTNILANLIASFVTYYFTNSVGITAAVVGTMILVSKLLDGVSDFIMGVIIEHTHTKWGQAKPWLIIGIIPMAVSMVLMFSCPSGLSDGGKVAWMYFTYIFCNVICYTVVLMAMSSMLVLTTGDTEQRTKASAFNQILGSISLIVVSMFTENLASAHGWFLVSLVYAIIAVVAMLFSVFFCHERHHLIRDNEEEIKAQLAQKEQEKGSLIADLKMLLRIPHFWSLLFITLFKFLATGAATGTAIYFFTDVLGNSAIFGVITMIWFIPPMIVNLGITPLVKKVGSYHKILAIGFFMQVIGWFIEAYTTNMALMYFGALLVGIHTLRRGDDQMVFEKKGIIFDLDGVICFTDKYHYLAWKALADRLGIYFDEKINDRLRGVSRMSSLEIILERSDAAYTSEQKEALAAEKNESYRELLKQMSPADLSEEVKSTLDELRRRGYVLAIGSSSKNAGFILERIGLGDFFDAVADGRDITHSKPDPEVFLCAAAKLGLAPAACAVVEDAKAGIQAAKAGGMTALALFGDAKDCGLEDYDLLSFSDLLNIYK